MVWPALPERRPGAIWLIGMALALAALITLPLLVTAPHAQASPSLTFQSPVAYGTGADSIPARSAIGDVNGDAMPDIVAVNAFSSTVSVLLGNGDGTFQTVSEFVGCTDPLTVVLGDFNGDSHLDIAAGTVDNQVCVFLNDGHGSFGSPSTLTPNVACVPVGLGDVFDSCRLAAANFNGDSHLDLAVVGGNGGTIALLLGNGDGTFDEHDILFDTDQLSGIVTGDFNGDGHVDIAVASYSEIVLYVLLGNGNGTFTDPVEYTSGITWISDLVIGDFNGDGHPDLVVANLLDGQVSVLLGSSDGTFAHGVVYTPGGNPLGLAVGDFNGDGFLDLAVMGFVIFPSESVSVLLGDGDGALSDPISVDVGGTDALGLAAGDLDNNGQADLVIPNGDFAATVTVVLAGPTSHRPRMTLAVGAPKQTKGDVTYVTSDTHFTLTGTDTGSGVQSVSYRTYKRGHSAPSYTRVTHNSTSFTLASGGDGIYEIDYYGTDGNGDSGPTHTIYVTKDGTAPTATLAAGSPKVLVQGQMQVQEATKLTLTGRDSKVGVAAVAYRYYQASASSEQAPHYTIVQHSSTTFALSGADGLYKVEYTTTNALGVTSSPSTVMLELNNQGPTTTLTPVGQQATAAAAMYVNGSTTLDLVATGATPVQTLYYRVYAVSATPPNYSVVHGATTDIALAGEPDGMYYIDSYAIDALGNVGVVQSQTVTLDTQAPEIDQPSGPVQSAVTLTATDAGAGVGSLSYRVYKRGTDAGTFTTVTGTSAQVTLPSAAGTYVVDYYATDLVGNRSATHSAVFVVAGAPVSFLGQTALPYLYPAIFALLVVLLVAGLLVVWIVWRRRQGSGGMQRARSVRRG